MEITTRIPLKTTSSFVRISPTKIYCIIMGGEFFLTRRALFPCHGAKGQQQVAYEGLFTISFNPSTLQGAPILVEVLKICSPSSATATFYKGDSASQNNARAQHMFYSRTFQALINKAKNLIHTRFAYLRKVPFLKFFSVACLRHWVPKSTSSLCLPQDPSRAQLCFIFIFSLC